MVILSTSQVDISRSNLHTIEEAKGTFCTGIVSILTEAIALRVLLARLFHQVEALQAPISLQQVLDLVLGVLLRQTADEKLTGTIVHLCRYNAHCYSVDDRDWAPGLDLRVLVELRWSADPQHDIIIPDTIQLNSSRSFLNATKLKEDKLLLSVLAGVDDRVPGVQDAASLLELLIQELLEVSFCHVWLYVAHVYSPRVESRAEVALEGGREPIAEGQRVVIILSGLLSSTASSATGHQRVLLLVVAHHAAAHLRVR